MVARLTFGLRSFQSCGTTDLPFLLSARWVVRAGCLRSLPCAAVGRLTARYAAGGENVPVGFASVRPQTRGSSTGLAANATTGSVLHGTGKLAMVCTVLIILAWVEALCSGAALCLSIKRYQILNLCSFNLVVLAAAFFFLYHFFYLCFDFMVHHSFGLLALLQASVPAQWACEHNMTFYSKMC